MGKFEHLPLTQLDGAPLPHTLFRQDSDPAGLLIILPGLHYGHDGPIYYHLTRHLWKVGWDSLGLTYGFQARLSDDFMGAWPASLEESRNAIRLALESRPYPTVTVAGKSMGSGLLAALSSSMPELGAARLAHHTPPLGMPGIDEGLGSAAQPTYLAIGTADRFYDPDSLEALRGRGALVRVVDGADHGLDVPGDLSATMAAVRQVVDDTMAFCLSGKVPGLRAPAGED